MDTYKQILDNMATAVIVLDDTLRIATINSAAENLLHTSAPHAEGQPLHELIMRADTIVPSLRAALETGQPYTERDATVRLPDTIVHGRDTDTDQSIQRVSQLSSKFHMSSQETRPAFSSSMNQQSLKDFYDTFDQPGDHLWRRNSTT